MKVEPSAAAAQTGKCTSSDYSAFEDTRRNMAAMLADNVEEEYLWSISLTSTTKV